MSDLGIAAFLWILSRIVPRAHRERWLEEWRAELAHGRRSMILGAPLDAWEMRKGDTHLFATPGAGRRWRGPWRTDVRQTFRSLARSPGHVITVSLCLGIGIAVSVTTFSILSSILTGDLPGIQDRQRLMRIYLTAEGWLGHRSPSNASLSDYEILRQGSPSLPEIAAEGRWDFAVRTPSGPAAIEGAFVSGNYFQVLGTQPALGRLLRPDDDRLGAEAAVVLSHAFWTAQLGASAGVVGSTIIVGGQDMQVVGVAPRHFSGTDVGDLGEPPGLRYRIYVPLSLSATLAPALGRHEEWLTIGGRAVSDRSRDAMAAEMQPLAGRIEAANPRLRKNAGVMVLQSGAGPRDTPTVVALIITLLMSAPITVLLIGCANVANLQLVRATLRRRELAVRLSVGASRGQLVGLLAFESVVLAVTACAAGALGTHLLLKIAALVIPFHISIDWPVLAFIVVVAALVVLVTGVIPGWLATRAREGISLAASSRSTTGGTSRVRRALVVAQIALSLLLLLTAALFTRSLAVLAGRVPHSAARVIVAEMRFDTLGYSQEQRSVFVESLRARLEPDGRVEAIGLNTTAPLRQGGRRFWLPGDAPNRVRTSGGGEVTPDWFEAAGAEVLRGRTFTQEDVRLGNAAIVDRAFIQKYRLPEPVLGTVLRVERSGPDTQPVPQDDGVVGPSESVIFQSGPGRTTVATYGDAVIVGIAGDTLSRPLDPAPRPSLYVPLREIPDYLAFYVRSNRPEELRQQVRETMAAIDPNLPAIEISTLANRFDDDAGDIRLLARAASGLGLAAVILAVAGVYSVVAFFVSLRTHEFGIRLAIGARPRDIVTMVIEQSSRLVLVGVFGGLVLSAPVLLFLGKAFPYASPFDPIALLGPAAVLSLTALVAASLPARRAGQVDPCAALRSE